ncbi:MAG: ATP-binding protein [Candidatus Aenigmarchaeota archaeon]|nr:ATP-binding protein [Candidatus Aenigmarchaeota archaeon]
MNKEDIVDYIKEYEEFQPKVLKRELKVPLHSKFIVSIIGPRRAGKTYYLFQLRKSLSNSFYLNFEDPRLFGISYKDIREIINIYIEIYGKNPSTLLLDEIQNVKGWEKVVRELHDLRKYEIFITGSSSKLLSKEIATRLRGRSLSFLLLPFSFREFLVAKGINVEKYMTREKESKIKKLLFEYLEFGGFPDVVLNEEKTKILKEYSDLILFRDFIERHKVRYVEFARFLHTFILQNFSNEVSVNSIFNKIKSLGVKVSKNSLYSYLSKLEDTSFFFFLNKFSQKPHLKESYPKKIYLCDTGLTKVVRFKEDRGRLMENVVFLDLLKRKNENALTEIFYWRDYQGREVDFVIKEGTNVKALIQVSYEFNENTEKREIENLIEISKSLHCRNLFIVSWDVEEKIRRMNRTIHVVPLYKWLTLRKFT